MAQICTKLFVGWVFAPDPTGGAYSAPPDPLAGLRGPTSKGGEGREGERRGREGRKGDWREGKESAPLDLNPGDATALINGFVDDALRNTVPNVDALARQCRVSVFV